MNRIFGFVPICFALPLFSFLALASLQAENPQPLSLLLEKDAPTQGFFGLEGGDYTGNHGDQVLLLPQFYYGAKQLFNWTLFGSPVEFDLGHSVQLSIRNVGGSSWSFGTGVNYNSTSVRERSSSSPLVPGYDLDSFGPYLFGRYQATKQIGIELSERADYYYFNGGEDSLYRPDNYVQTETRLLVDFDLRHMDPRPEVRDSGFYTGVYGFARQRPDSIWSNAVGASFQSNHDQTWGVGGLGEYLWSPWLSGNFGLVAEGEMTADADRVYLGETDQNRARGYVYPHLLVNQDVWPGGSIEAQFGPRMMNARFGQSDQNPVYLHAGLTVSQAVSEHISIAILYEYDGDPYKPTYVGQDQTGPDFLGVSTSYHF